MSPSQSPRMVRWTLPALPLILAIGLLEYFTQSGKLPSYLVPKPTEVLAALTGETSGALRVAFFETFRSAALALLASVLLGGLAGIALSTSKWIRLVFYPYAVFFQTVPIIAIAPILVIWLGYGLPTVVSAAWIVSVFPMITATLNGILSTEPALKDLFKLYGASRSQTLTRLLIPSALPSVLTGARIAAGLAVIGAIVGEFIAGGGLGGLIDTARTQQKLDLVFASVLLAAVLGWIFFTLIGGLSRLLLGSWHATELERT